MEQKIAGIAAAVNVVQASGLRSWPKSKRKDAVGGRSTV